MRNEKTQHIKNDNADTKEIRNLIIITIIIAALAVGLYFLTDKVTSKNSSSTTTTSKIKINDDICTVGMMFNRPYDEYYVFLYNSTSNSASQYNTLLNNYKSKTNAIKTYFVDLNLKFNSSFVSDSSNKKPTTASEVKVKNSALVLIKNGKVSKYYESTSEYEKVLN